MEYDMTAEEKKRLEKWFEDIGISEAFYKETVQTMLRNNIADTGNMVYVIWKMLQERFPEKVEATNLLYDLCFEFGKIQIKGFSATPTPSGFLRALLSDANLLAWNIELTDCNDEKAVLILRAFPYLVGAQHSGANEQEIKILREKVFIGIADGLVSPFPDLNLLADEDGISIDGSLTMTLVGKALSQSIDGGTSAGNDDFLKTLHSSNTFSREKVTSMLREKVGERGLLVYLAWKMMRERFPWMDSTAFLCDACYRFGKSQTGTFVKDGTPDIWLRQISSRAGILVWDQMISSFNAQKAVKKFKYCPHIEAARSAGATPSELRTLCRDILMGADFGTLAPYPYLELSFPGKTYAEGGECEMTCIRRS